MQKLLLLVMFIALILVLTMSSYIVPEDSSSTDAYTASGRFNHYDPPIKLTTVRRINQGEVYQDGESIENNAWTALLAEYGIQVSYLWAVDASLYDAKLNLSIFSDQIPDVAMYNSQGYAFMLRGGYAKDMTEIYEKYATPLTKKLMSDGDFGINCGKVDGRLMAIPVVDPTVNQPQVLWIRKDWLDKHGLPIPKTIDQLIQTARVFADTGNDAIGLGIAGKDNLMTDWGSLTGFFQGYGVNPTRYFGSLHDYYIDDAGNVRWSGELSNMTLALHTLHEMYRDGLIADDFSTWDAGVKLAEAIINGRCGMFYGQWWLPMWPIPDNMRKEPEADWIPVWPPTLDGSNAVLTTNFPASFFNVVSGSFDNPEIVIDVLNLLLELQWGENVSEEDYWRYIENPDGLKDAGKGNLNAIIHIQAPSEPLTYYTNLTKAVSNRNPGGLNIGMRTMYDSIISWLDDSQNPALFDTGFAFYRIYADPEYGYFNLVNRMNNDGYLKDNIFMDIPGPIMTEKLPSLIRLQDDIILRIIYGESPVTDYDKFLEIWRENGGNDVLAEVADWIKRNN